jgi:hypothetical protein
MKFVTAKAAPQTTEDVLIVPVNVTNTQELVALDIPLSFSEGAFLEKVTYTERVKTFEVKIDQIDNDKNTVVIGLISMVTGERPDLAIGTGPVAELHFKLEPGVNSVEINPIEMQNPNHSLTYYWNDFFQWSSRGQECPSRGGGGSGVLCQSRNRDPDQVRPPSEFSESVQPQH